MSDYVVASNTKAVPLKELVKELFTPTKLDNQDSTEILEKIVGIGIQALIDELEDKSKATYKYTSVSGTQFSFAHCHDHIRTMRKLELCSRYGYIFVC